VKVKFSLPLRIRSWGYIREQKNVPYIPVYRDTEIGDKPHTLVILTAKEPLVLM
jgi:hypothetical protein